MMMRPQTDGYVLIRTHPGHAYKVAARLHESEYSTTIQEVHVLLGPYDVLVYLKATSPEKLGEVVVNGIQRIEGVAETLTLVKADNFGD